MQRYTGITYTQRISAAAPLDAVLQPGSTVTVYQSGTEVPAQLFEDTGGQTEIPNPLTSDALTGAFTFCAANGLYDLTITKADLPSYTLPQILLNDTVGVVPRVWPVSIAHAELLTLTDTTPIQLVEAPGAGIVRTFQGGLLLGQFSAGGYTIPAACYMGIAALSLDSALASAFLINDPDADIANVTALFGATPVRAWLSPYQQAPPSGWGLVTETDPLSAWENQPLSLWVNSDFSISGGHADNRLTGFVFTYDWTIV